MKLYINNIVNQLQRYNATLARTSLFIDKPWALIDDEFELQKLIFKENKELILSKNGQVQIGKWDYFPQAKSLLIDRNSDKILCNEAFINEGVLILKLDGTNNRFFILANENLIPDLDVKEYLKKLRYKKLNIIEISLFDGSILEVERPIEQQESMKVGNYITVESEILNDGKYQLSKNNQFLEIANSKIKKILTEKTYSNPNNELIVIQQQYYYEIIKGDYVFMNGKQLNNAIIDFSKSKKIIVRDGMFIRFERKNKIISVLSKYWKEFTECFD